MSTECTGIGYYTDHWKRALVCKLLRAGADPSKPGKIRESSVVFTHNEPDDECGPFRLYLLEVLHGAAPENLFFFAAMFAVAGCTNLEAQSSLPMDELIFTVRVFLRKPSIKGTN